MPKSKKVVRTKYLYRKSKKKRVTGVVLFILLVVLLIGVGYLVTQEWAKRFGPNAPQSSVSPVSIPSEEESSLPASSEEQSSNPSDAVLTQAKMKQISAATLRQTGDAGIAAILQDVKAEGYTGVCFELKDTEGILAYTSSSALAAEYGAVGEGAVSLEALVKAAQDAGLTPAATMTALRDNKSAHAVNYQNSFAYMTPDGANWLDNSPANGGKAWLNPYMENARNYISGLCGEISAAGIKTIILTDVCFPYKNTQQLNEVNPFTTREKVLGQLVSEARTAAGNDAVVYAAYTPRTVAEYGIEGIKAMGPYLAPVLDSTEAAAYETALRPVAGISEQMTAEEVFGYVMLGDMFAGFEVDGQEVVSDRIALMPAEVYAGFWQTLENDEIQPARKMSYIVY